ncbi:MAG: cytochrome b/b6 domain-containing protein [Pseudomonadota bacterium]
MRANTATHYGSVAKTFHWLTALLIATVIPLGIIANGLPFETSEELARKAFLFSLHKTVGLAVFFVALARIAWAMAQEKPGLLTADKPVQAFLASAVHWLLYGSLLLVPLTGWIHHAATTGFAPIWWPFGQSLPFVPKDVGLAETFAGLHLVFERVLVLALVLHIAGALKHHFIDRDATLLRMLPGDHAVPHVAAHRRHLAPPLAAVAIWAGAVGVGGAVGVYSHDEGVQRGPALETVQSDWAVRDGTIAITVRQLGSDVSGSFGEWTAAISFDPEVSEGEAGTAEVTINIASLELGSVTSQALGADFFDAATFPTATYAGPIIATPDSLIVDGTLTIRDIAQPIPLPFTLEITDGVATAAGEVIIDRRAFDVGLNQNDEGTLGFEVLASITLTADQPE